MKHEEEWVGIPRGPNMKCSDASSQIHHVFTYSFHTEVKGDMELGTGILFLAFLALNMDILRTAALGPLPQLFSSLGDLYRKVGNVTPKESSRCAGAWFILSGLSITQKRHSK